MSCDVYSERCGFVAIGILSVIAYKKKEIYPEQLAMIIIHNTVTLLLVGMLEYFAAIIGRG